MTAMFRSFSTFNYRIWFLGALVSNVGGWMQATAQDWVVLTELTDNDATAMGSSTSAASVRRFLSGITPCYGSTLAEG